MKTSDVLQRARALIADERRWCTGEFKKGNRLCALGALGCRVGIPLGFGKGVDALDKLIAFCDAEFRGESVASVNDVGGHPAVLRLYDLAISAAMSDEAAT